MLIHIPWFKTLIITQFNSHYLRLGPRQVPESSWQNILSPGNLECRLWLMKYIRWLQVLIVKIGLVYDLTSVVWWTKVTHKYQNYAEVKLLIAWLSKRKRASLVAQLVKNPPTMQETWVGKIPLEKGTVTHSSILAWRIPWTVWSMRSKRVGHDWAAFTNFQHWLMSLRDSHNIWTTMKW